MGARVSGLSWARGGEPELRVKSLQDVEDSSGYIFVSSQAVWLAGILWSCILPEAPRFNLQEACRDTWRWGLQSGSGAGVAREERDSAASSWRGQDSFTGSPSQKAAGLTLVKQAELCTSVCPSALGGQHHLSQQLPLHAWPTEQGQEPWHPGRSRFSPTRAKQALDIYVFKKKGGGKETKKQSRHL